MIVNLGYRKNKDRVDRHIPFNPIEGKTFIEKLQELHE